MREKDVSVMMRLLLLVQIQILELENLNFLSWSWFSHYRVNVVRNKKYRNYLKLYSYVYCVINVWYKI